MSGCLHVPLIRDNTADLLLGLRPIAHFLLRVHVLCTLIEFLPSTWQLGHQIIADSFYWASRAPYRPLCTLLRLLRVFTIAKYQPG